MSADSQKVKSENLEQTVEQYLDYLSSGRIASEETVRAYRSDLEHMKEYLLEEKDMTDVRDIDRETIRSYFSHLQDNGYENSTLVRKLASLRSFFDRLVEEKGILEQNPTRKMQYPRVTKKLPDYLTEQEMEELLESPDPGTLTGRRDRVILELIYSTGMRAGELHRLNIEDIDQMGGTIRIQGKGNRERIVPVGEEALEAVQEYLRAWKRAGRIRSATRGPLICNRSGNRLSTRSIRRAVSRHARRTGISKEVSPHTIRHTFATHMLKNGTDLRTLQEILGHENLHTTEIYTHITDAHLKETYDGSHPRA